MLLSKVLQAVVTGVAFGEKEPYMIPLNSIASDNVDFVTALIARITLKSKKKVHNQSKLRLSFLRIAQMRTKSVLLETKTIPVNPYAQDQPEEALEFFQQEFASCKDKITKRLAKDSAQVRPSSCAYVFADLSFQAHSLFVTYTSSLKTAPRRVQVESVCYYSS